MKTDRRARVVRHVSVLLCCTTLVGCGSFSANREANLYRAEQATKTQKELETCRDSPIVVRHKLDHRSATSTQPDCFQAVVTGSSRLLIEHPPSVQDSASLSRQILKGNPSEPESTAAKKKEVEIFSPAELAQTTSTSALIGQLAWPAMLSKMTYRRFVDIEKRSGDKSACTDLALHPLQRWNALKNTKSRDHWEPWKPEGIGCQAAGGLFYETYVYWPYPYGASQKEKFTLAIIVFRGTENYRSQVTDDWGANLALAFDLTPSQFRQVRLDLDKLVDGLKNEGAEKLRIYTAGHSLGGSLAQLAAYLNEDIQAAYAYNTSPVTGWTWLRGLKAKDPNVKLVDDPKIIRVWQDAEILGMVRTFSNAANSTVQRTGRTDVSFDFPASREVLSQTKNTDRLGGGSALHSITLLACNLAARVALDAPGAFGFTKEMAQAAIDEKNGHYTEEKARATEGLCQVLGNEDADGKPKTCDVNWIKGTVKC